MMMDRDDKRRCRCGHIGYYHAAVIVGPCLECKCEGFEAEDDATAVIEHRKTCGGRA